MIVRFFADSERIQKLLSKRRSDQVEKVCQLFIPAKGHVNTLCGHMAHAQGIADAMMLIRRLAEAQKGGAPGVGIFVGTKAAKGGKDVFYFIGTLNGVCERISKLPETMRV